jgi:hypothetical protein
MIEHRIGIRDQELRETTRDALFALFEQSVAADKAALLLPRHAEAETCFKR